MFSLIIFAGLISVVFGANLHRAGLIPLVLNGRIVGGVDTQIEQFPWQISMTHLGSHRCGGFIISKNHIITAAHCTYGVAANMIGVRYGSSLRTSGGIHVAISRYIEHPDYNIPTAINNDISILIITQSIVFRSGVQPIDLPYQDETIADGELLSVSGWGTLYQGGPASNTLQYVTIPKISQTDCSKAYEFFNEVTDNMICGGYLGQGGRDACQGDSGGPLIYKNKVHGIVSWGSGCAHQEYPGVYTRISAYRNWIDNTMYYNTI